MPCRVYMCVLTCATAAVEHALVASNERCKHLRVYPEPKGKKYAGNIEASLIKWDTGEQMLRPATRFQVNAGL